VWKMHAVMWIHIKVWDFGLSLCGLAILLMDPMGTVSFMLGLNLKAYVAFFGLASEHSCATVPCIEISSKTSHF
jgi:hypothetical protein